MINAFCFYFGDHSWCRHARDFFNAWRKQEPVQIVPWDDAPAEYEGERSREPSGDHPGIGLGPIERMPCVIGSKRIACVVWETTVMPGDKRSVLKKMDEIWTPSSWGRQLLIENGFEPHRVNVVPEGVDVDRFQPLAKPNDSSDRKFRFLFIGKWEVRKGVEDLIASFCEEFEPHEPVELIIHGWNPYLPGFNLEANLRRLIGPNSPSIVTSLPCDEDKLIDLYNSCDVFVLPTRAEGWGLPITEAMACGLPVIVTEYSGPVDFVDSACGYFIPVEKMIPAYDPYFFRSEDNYGEWAQPDLASLRALMRHAFENQDEVREKGRVARQTVCKRWTWDDAVATARGLLSH
jgi:glycosyltransferase involved in cell wall biosynthesis